MINYLTTSKTWHAYKTTTIGSNGFFHFSEAKSHGYCFKVVLPACGAGGVTFAEVLFLHPGQ